MISGWAGDFGPFFFGDTDTSKAVARSVQPVGQVHRVKREGLRAPDPKWQTLWFFFHPIAAWLNAPIFFKGLRKLKVDVHFFMTRIV